MLPIYLLLWSSEDPFKKKYKHILLDVIVRRVNTNQLMGNGIRKRGKASKYQKIYSEWGWGKNVKNVGFKCQIHCADLNWASLVTKVTWRLQKQINDVIIPSGEGFIFFFFVFIGLIFLHLILLLDFCNSTSRGGIELRKSLWIKIFYS